MKLFFTVFFCCSALTVAQSSTVVEAHPAVSWDSLRSLMVYPEIARRAGVEDIARVKVDVDANGNVTNVEFAGYGIFSESVKSAIYKVRWIPETQNGTAKTSQIVFDVQFQLKDIKNFPKRRVLTVEADALGPLRNH